MLTQTMALQELSKTESTTIETTLYDLITSISDAVGSTNSELVTATVVHVLNAHRVQFAGDPRRLEVICA